MFERLKKCKTIREIFEVLGKKPFEKAAEVILIMWTMLPLTSIITHIVWADKDVEDYIYQFNILSKYQTVVMFMGLLTIQLVIVYGIGLIIWNRGKIKSNLIGYMKKNHGIYFWH